MSFGDNVPTAYAQNSNKAFSAPWHKFANPIDDATGKDIDAALKAGDLAWSPIKKELMNPWGEPSGVFGIYRDDCETSGKKKMLGTATERYEPISARQAFDFLEDIIGEAGYTIESVGHMKDGQLMFANVRMGDIDIVAGDTHAVYMQFVAGNDGKTSLEVVQSFVRMVCSNTIAHALSSATAKLKVKHTQKALSRMNNIAAFLQAAEMEQKAFADKLRFLATIKTDADFQREFMKRFLKTEEKENALRDTVTKKIEAIEQAEGVDGIIGIRGTAYELLQKVTRAFDHNEDMGRVKAKDLTADEKSIRRFESISFGNIAAKKTEAFNLLLEMAS